MKRYFSSINKNRNVLKGTISPTRIVPNHIKKPPYAINGNVPDASPFIPLLNKDQQKKLKEVNSLASHILKYAANQIKVGITTDEIDAKVHDEIIHNKAYPSPLNYYGFPKSICTSINEVICHGIPDSRPLEDGDIINIDISVYLNGFHGDTSRTFEVGHVNDENKRFLKNTENILMETIKKCCFIGSPIRHVGAYIQNETEKYNYSVIKEFAGHGIGEDFHMLPLVLHYRNNENWEMKNGMAFTIEPAIAIGTDKIIRWDDGWTCSTRDGLISSQFEHTILITENGPDILTL